MLVHPLCHISPQADTLGCWNPFTHKSHNCQLFFLSNIHIWSADFRLASLKTGGLIYWPNALLQNYWNSKLFFQHNLFYYKFHQGFKNKFSTWWPNCLSKNICLPREQGGLFLDTPICLTRSSHGKILPEVLLWEIKLKNTSLVDKSLVL